MIICCPWEAQEYRLNLTPLLLAPIVLFTQAIYHVAMVDVFISGLAFIDIFGRATTDLFGYERVELWQSLWCYHPCKKGSVNFGQWEDAQFLLRTITLVSQPPKRNGADWTETRQNWTPLLIGLGILQVALCYGCLTIWIFFKYFNLFLMLYWEFESSFLDIGKSFLTGCAYSYVVSPSMGCEMPVVEVQ